MNKVTIARQIMFESGLQFIPSAKTDKYLKTKLQVYFVETNYKMCENLCIQTEFSIHSNISPILRNETASLTKRKKLLMEKYQISRKIWKHIS